MVDITFGKVIINLIQSNPKHVFNFVLLLAKQYALRCVRKRMAKVEVTRMHSSRMRTVRSSSRLGGVPGLGGVPSVGGTWSRGVYLVQGGIPGLGDVPGAEGVLGPGGCTWSWGMYLVLRGVPGLGVCTWS